MTFSPVNPDPTVVRSPAATKCKGRKIEKIILVAKLNMVVL